MTNALVLLLVMIRTKDLLLLVIALVFVIVGMFSTLSAQFFDEPSTATHMYTEIEVPEYTAEVVTEEGLDRAAHRARLQSLLAKGEVIQSSPSVEDAVYSEPESNDETRLQCGSVDTGIGIARQWPLTGVTMQVAEGQRVIVHTTMAMSPVTSAVGTSSPLLAQTAPPSIKNLLTLPQFPTKAATSRCLDSEIIGVTTDGSLMFNADAILYRTSSSDTLVGYARDGFPIYGAYVGEVDECGGVDAPAGYRYVVSSGESTFMNCFVGTPQAFSL